MWQERSNNPRKTHRLSRRSLIYPSIFFFRSPIWDCFYSVTPFIVVPYSIFVLGLGLGLGWQWVGFGSGIVPYPTQYGYQAYSRISGIPISSLKYTLGFLNTVF
ncbi:hypothetical protein HanXRQr2_Chr06g0265701 [Helianthus annuus]|uniref:Uncharacterized protein n=1 Tax=Helianthus annuus TaxID=4232 RepID=A0A9K3IVN7_HELAN|nr:hypothetical protein HanXRQr2_Chr06g0265701 [Helianthus annuus]